MVYALVITIAAGLFLLGLLGGLALLYQRGGWRGVSLGSWRWQPSALGVTLLLLVGGLVLWRLAPVFLFLPAVIPFFWRWRRGRSRPTFRAWRSGRRRPPANGHDAADGRAIEGRYRNLDDE